MNVRNIVAAGLLVFGLKLFAADSSVKTAASPGNYLNPIGDPPIHLQDPFIFVQSRQYYLFGVAARSEGFQCYESTDLVHWKADGWAWHRSGLHVARGELHAPQIFEYRGMFCMVYSGSMPSGPNLALAASTKPEGPYHDLHAPWLSLRGGCSDGNVFIDDNGKVYLIYSQRSTQQNCNVSVIYGVALSMDLTKVVGQPAKLLEASQPWELAHRDSVRWNDNPRMFRVRSKYFLTYSANGPRSSDYAIGYATADKPLGPWSKSSENPLVSTHAETGVVGPGRGAIFRSPDAREWFMVYGSSGDATPGSEDRVVNIDRLAVLANGKLSLVATRSPQPLPAAAK